MKSFKAQKNVRIRNKIILFLVTAVLISTLGSSVSVQAVSYPGFYPDKYYMDANVGEKVRLSYVIYPEYKNERISIDIYDSSGEHVAWTTKDFYNEYATPFSYAVLWDTKGEMAGEYTVVTKMEFYSYLSWHECPRSKTTYITLNTSRPKKQTVKSVKVQTGRKLKVSWKKDSTVDGYQIQYSMDKKFKKGVKNVTVYKNNTTKKTIKKLKTGKQYYVRVCSFKYVMKQGEIQRLYGVWSKAKKSSVIQ